MTDQIKDIPDLNEFEDQEWFKTTYDAHKADEFRKMLDDLGVAYASGDNKSVLTYRYLEATNGLKGDNNAKPADKATKEETKPTDNSQETGIKATDTNSAINTPGTSAKNTKADTPAQENAGTKSTDTGKPEVVSNSQVNDKTEVKADVSKTETKPTKADGSEDQAPISVKNHHSRDIVEPASGTYLPKGKTTKIHPTGHVSRERILSNIEQLNHLNGNALEVKDAK